MNDIERLNLVKWHILRYDGLRASNGSRGAMVLTVDSLLVVGITFLLNSVFSQLINTNKILSWLVIVFAIITLAILFASISYAISSVISIKPASQLFGKAPKHPFFTQRDTVDSFNNFEQFETEFNKTNIQNMTHYGLGELWTVINQHYLRYQNLRSAIKTMRIAVGLFIITCITLVVSILVLK